MFRTVSENKQDEICLILLKDWDKRPDWRYTFSTYRAVLENCGAVYEKEKQ